MVIFILIFIHLLCNACLECYVKLVEQDWIGAIQILILLLLPIFFFLLLLSLLLFTAVHRLAQFFKKSNVWMLTPCSD